LLAITTVLHVATIVEDIDAASQWIARALQSSAYAADFSPASLWEIDRFFDEQSTDGVPNPKGLLSESLGPRLFALGAYVGEVIRRASGGQWTGDDDDPQVELNVALQGPDGRVCWPVQRVMKRLANGSEEGIAAYGLALGLSVGQRPAT
jgi:hypothetical protein